MTRHREPRNDVDVSYGNFFNEVPILSEYLHSRALVAPIAHHEFATVTHNRDFSRVPKLPFLFTRYAELELERARLIEDLKYIYVYI